MELNIKDISDLLQLSEIEVNELIKKKKIPFFKINQQYRFNRSEINEWILKNNLKISKDVLKLSETSRPVKITELVKRGGVLYNIPGGSIDEVLKNAASQLTLPKGVTKEIIASILLEREEMMPTAAGNGIAIPHPRTPIVSDTDNESVSLCFLASPVDYHALDKIPVHTLFVILSANQRRHLEILSKVAYLCQQADFNQMLLRRESAEKIFAFIGDREKEF